LHHISRANKILVIGLGGSAGVAHIFCDSLGSLGILSFCLQDRSIMQNAVPTLNSEDVIIGISHSGETLEIVSAVKSAKEYGAHTICITNYSPSSLADVTQLPLITGVPSNLLGSYSCQARISQLVILELILHELSKLVEKRDDNHLLNSQSENKQTNKKTNIQKKELTL
jgi:DNA-binding MurR/RpiR family transcriptional regulator